MLHARGLSTYDATVGTPLDVAASKLAIETFLPADDVIIPWLAAAGQAAVSK